MTSDSGDRPWTPELGLRLARELGACALCGAARTRLGPAGHWNADPICETCLAEVAPELTLILGAASTLRLFAAADPVDDPETFWVCAERVWQVAKRYELVLAEEWGSEDSFLLELAGRPVDAADAETLLGTARDVFDRLAAAAWRRLTEPGDADGPWR